MYAADAGIYGMDCSILNGDGIVKIAGFNVEFFLFRDILQTAWFIKLKM